MSNDLLKEVLELEQQIESDLGKERKRAEVWLTEACRMIDQELECDQLENTRAFERHGAESICTVRQTSAQKLRHQRHRAKALAELSDESLLTLLKGRLNRVLTGRDDDCPDDQS
jgi:hypothetical protein